MHGYSISIIDKNNYINNIRKIRKKIDIAQSRIIDTHVRTLTRNS